MSDYSQLSDIQLTDLLKNGDNAAFKTIYQRYWKKLLYFANQKTGHFPDAENLVQDVFASLWQRHKTLTITATLENYLVVSVKYRVLKRLDKQRSERLYNENRLSSDLLDNSTQEYLDFEELRHRLEKLVAELPAHARLIFKLNKEEGKSHKEIADQLGMTEKAVNAQLVRAKKKLRDGLNSFLMNFLL